MMLSIFTRSRQSWHPPADAAPALTDCGASRRLAAAAALLVAATLSACSLSRPAPVKHMFLLETVPPAAAVATKPGSLRIGVIGVAAPFRSRTLVYRRDDIRFESDFYSEFFVTPAAMVAEETAKTLTAAKVFRRVIAPGAAPDEGDYVLDGFVGEFYGDLREAGKPAAVLTATYYLAPANVTPSKVIWSREYRQRVVAADGSPEALARAWNAALTAVLGELARDLAAVTLPPA